MILQIFRAVAGSQVGWPDTGYFRNPNYHAATDTPETLDYSFLASVTQLIAVAGARYWNGSTAKGNGASSMNGTAESIP